MDVLNFLQSVFEYARSLGFSNMGVTKPHLEDAIPHFQAWLKEGYHGSLDYMEKHAALRMAPEMLFPKLASVLCFTLPYFPASGAEKKVLTFKKNDNYSYISHYAQGEDYHKVIRKRLKKMVVFMQTEWSKRAPIHAKELPLFRVFTDSAPVMEVAFAAQSGMGWQGKNTLFLTQEGSFHFLGEIYTTLSLHEAWQQKAMANHCGVCTRCLDACPTNAFVAPYVLDARRCISYWTIEYRGSIPKQIRPLIGSHVYGCDECQTVCPWNRFSHLGDPAFFAKNGLDAFSLQTLFLLEEAAFEALFAKSPLRRIGHVLFLRNLAVALGNQKDLSSRTVLLQRQHHPSALVREHVVWALEEITKSSSGLTL